MPIQLKCSIFYSCIFVGARSLAISKLSFWFIYLLQKQISCLFLLELKLFYYYFNIKPRNVKFYFLSITRREKNHSQISYCFFHLTNLTIAYINDRNKNNFYDKYLFLFAISDAQIATSLDTYNR